MGDGGGGGLLCVCPKTREPSLPVAREPRQAHAAARPIRRATATRGEGTPKARVAHAAGVDGGGEGGKRDGHDTMPFPNSHLSPTGLYKLSEPQGVHEER